MGEPQLYEVDHVVSRLNHTSETKDQREVEIQYLSNKRAVQW